MFAKEKNLRGLKTHQTGLKPFFIKKMVIAALCEVYLYITTVWKYLLKKRKSLRALFLFSDTKMMGVSVRSICKESVSRYIQYTGFPWDNILYLEILVY